MVDWAETAFVRSYARQQPGDWPYQDDTDVGLLHRF